MDKLIIQHDDQLNLQGSWTLAHVKNLEKEISKLNVKSAQMITLNGQAITALDSAGAWLITNWIKKLQTKITHIQLNHFSEQHKQLLLLIEKNIKDTNALPQPQFLNAIGKIGKNFIEMLLELRNYFNFVGELTFDSIRVLMSTKHLRWKSFFSIIERAGFQALLIIAVMSLMIGMVIAYQSGLQLKKYGANVYIVDLLGYAILREFGPLITAIMVAGRTGSAFTAQLGLMKVNQEIDALNTMGVTPAELLILPRIAGLVVTLPLLVIWADIFGVLGGMLVASHILQISWVEFLLRFQREVPLKELFIGLGKAPVFAFIIASISCLQGVSVQRNAESVGLLTTRSVVLSIFFIIVADSLFAVVLNVFKL